MIKIKKNTAMLLFRFRNYKQNDFIKEHLDILSTKGYVWMLKIGKKTSEEKLHQILDEGGWMVLRSPKSNGSKMYIAQYTEFQCEEPRDMTYPSYYAELLNQEDNYEYYSENTVFQWFRINQIVSLPGDISKYFVLAKTATPVNDVISTTRTAVMFIMNDEEVVF